jgi:methionyl-tRNA formyltransferase
MLRGAEVKVFGARLAPHAASVRAGQIQSVDADGMTVACGEGATRITVVQAAGKRRLSPNEWARGRGAAVGDRFDAVPATIA